MWAAQRFTCDETGNSPNCVEIENRWQVLSLSLSLLLSLIALLIFIIVLIIFIFIMLVDELVEGWGSNDF